MARRFRFGPFEVGEGSRALQSMTEPLPVPRKAIDVLLVLLDRRGQVVDKDELLSRVWPDVFVEENNLNQCISALRRALGDRANAPRYIETVARRGYRFTAEVAVQDEPLGAAPPPGSPARATGPVAVAVLPFRVQSEESEGYLALGLADALVTQLSRLPGVAVRASSASRGAAAGSDAAAQSRELGVDFVVAGSVRRHGKQIRVSAELVRGSDGLALWAETLDDSIDEIFALEDRLAARILGPLRERLGPTPQQGAPPHPTADVEAYQLCLMGRHFSNRLARESFRTAQDCFERAIARDPRYALAYAGLAHLFNQSVDLFLPPHDAMPRARQAAEHALSLDPGLADAHACLACVRIFYDWDWPAAERSHQRALELAPLSSSVRRLYGWSLVLTGRLADGLAHIERAASLDPHSVENHVYVFPGLYFARRHERAIEKAAAALRLYPDLWLAHSIQARAWGALGEPGRALLAAEQARQQAPDVPEAVADLGWALGQAGRRAPARAILRELQTMATQRHVPPFALALVHLGLGDTTAVFACLEQATAQRSWYLTWLKGAPILDPLRGDPRFAQLQQRVGL